MGESTRGEQAAICQQSYETFSDETARKVLNNEADTLQLRYHKTCYKRLCDEEKTKRAEAKMARNPAVLEEPEEKSRMAIDPSTATDSCTACSLCY